eukprot:1578148-Pleurochrysis_carterae.AAC.1
MCDAPPPATPKVTLVRRVKPFCIPKKSATVPVVLVVRGTAPAFFKCPKFLPARAATSLAH